jgi:hypothetical protein
MDQARVVTSMDKFGSDNVENPAVDHPWIAEGPQSAAWHRYRRCTFK